MNIRKQKSFWVVLAVCLLICIIGLYNVGHNDKFFEMSFSTTVSLVLAIGVSFYIVQKQTDRRIQKQLFIDLLKSLQVLVDDEKSYIFSDNNSKEILMRKREISNKLSFIKKYNNKFNFDTSTEFLEEKFNEYDEIIGNHIQDLDTLNKIHNDIKRPLSLMSQKLFEMMIELYN